MLIEAKDIKKSFKRGEVKALEDVSFALAPGRTLGILGESGSGKSTLARILLRIEDADSGAILFEGKDIMRSKEKELKAFRQKVQPVFQDPFVSLDPRFSVEDVLKEPLEVQGIAKPDWGRRIAEALRSVGLAQDYLKRRPAQLSGGECQRVAIARALILKPKLLICDEPVSSLDAFTRRETLDLFARLKKERGVSYIFISHDLRVIRRISDDVLVLKDGAVCEYGPKESVFSSPRHAYTKELLSQFI
jgi:ABC-type glutathione transport system ATPase component